MDEYLRIKSYSKCELALIYFPEVGVRTACQRLRRWMEKCTELMQKLMEAGYTAKQRIFSASQVKLIVKYLGEPY